VSTYIVTYDLNKESVRPKIVDEVKSTGDWAKLSESSYAIETAETPSAVYDRFAKLLDSNDNFYVISLRRPYHGQGPVEVNNWLASHLK